MFVQGVGLVPLPVHQADAERVAFLIGHLRHKLVPQPVLAGGVPEALRIQG